MQVLVTGGAGFIGSHVVDACLAAGHQVAALDDLSTGKRENVNPAATLHVADLRDRSALDEVLAAVRPEVIFHLAAKANVRESMVEPVLYAQVNILGSLNLLESARAHGTRKIVYASTGGAAYGEPQYLPADEDHPVNPLDPYGASKHHVEHYLFIYKKHFGLDYTTLRFPNVYGPRQDPYGEAGVVAIWTNQMLNGGQPVINGTGEQERDFVYVGDIARANVLAVEAGSGSIINLGSGVGTPIIDIFHALKRATGSGCDEVHAPAKQGEVFRIYLDASRAKTELGWEPEVSLEEGLALTVEHFQK
ncbi:MAG: NAD-dependent epimerase/dehydratase family protein [Chloroflexi bacterium]|nr:NAD-dependent epimerase/dehydratase family protein [Chloroflexota bacterium]